MFTFENARRLLHGFILRERQMSKLKIPLNFKSVSKFVLMTLFLTGCSSNTGQYFSNAPEKSMKMKHHTTILSSETHQLVNSMVGILSEVNFEYELITKQ